eukprot:TRINITY_DN87273_c0_g1_i1.p1 TRINITY_DN87273_c0_g1~~TRINITY_DN87273_c0_g1_i1.p1  ORF type:complete len:1052 (-),score=204.80 TRINITY_DN87273_c0_g1_i1:74-3229(-)
MSEGEQDNLHGNQTNIVKALEEWLKSPMGASADCDQKGFISILDVISMCADLRQLTGGSVAAVAEAVQAADAMQCCVVCRQDGRKVRLRGMLERIRQAAESFLEANAQSDGVSLLDVLRQPCVAKLVESIPEMPEKLATLKDALGSSEKVEVSGARVLQRQRPSSDSPADAEPGCLAPHLDYYWPQAMMAMAPWGNAPLVMGPYVGGVAAGGLGAASDSDTPPMAGSPNMQLMVPQDSSGWTWDQQRSADRREWRCNLVAEHLRQLPAVLSETMAKDGCIPLSQVFSASPALEAKMRGNVAGVMRTLQAAGSHSRVAVDSSQGTVRLRSTEERLCAVAEMILGGRERDAAPLFLNDLLASPEMKLILSEEAASSGDGDAEQAAVLREAVLNSDLIQVVEDDLVCWKSIPEILLHQLEDLLAEDEKVTTMLNKEGEVPLIWFANAPLVRRMMERAFIKPGKESLDALRTALGASEKFELDSACMSLFPRSSSGIRPKDSADQAWGHDPGRRRHLQLLPTEKDATDLRKLLKFYFEPFNLQHNRVLMSGVEAQRKGRVGYLQSKGVRPVFYISDICNMPRVNKLFKQYDWDASSWLLAAAMQTKEEMPVRISSKRQVLPRGTWATTEVKLELTYLAALRLIETNGHCYEAKWLTEPEINAESPLQALPPHTWLVMSYSISSDLSQSQSPKAVDLQKEICEGRLDPAVTAWETRQQKIKRQLLWQPADIICIQGLQSIDFSERCSETDSRWFSCDDEPALNHLVHLYRELAKLNYGVFFAPTMKLPGSSVVCFGSAVFWKRSRWHLERRWSVKSAAACVQLSSRLQAPQLIVCSCKSLASYAQDFGEELAASEMAFEICEVQQSVQEAADASGARPIWCGDFNLEPKSLLQVLHQEGQAPFWDQGSAAPRTWKSACSTILGEDPWTCASRSEAGKCSDLILHCDGVCPLAVLGGWPNAVVEKLPTILDLVRSGYPSDHMMQMALFVDSSWESEFPAPGSMPPHENSEHGRARSQSRGWQSGRRSSRGDACSSSDEQETQTRPPMRRRRQWTRVK